MFTSYGVLNWLPDIAGWAEVVSNHLKPAGVFYIVEFHPFAAVFEASESGDMVPTYGYFHHELFFEGSEPSYAGEGIIEAPTYEWQHSLGDIVSALVDAGTQDRVSCTSSPSPASNSILQWSGATTAGGDSQGTTTASRRCSRYARPSSGRRRPVSPTPSARWGADDVQSYLGRGCRVMPQSGNPVGQRGLCRDSEAETLVVSEIVGAPTCRGNAGSKVVVSIGRVVV